MSRRRHLFLTERAVPLPRWLEAFPAAEMAKPDAFAVKSRSDMIWLHLSSAGAEVARQVRATVSTAAGNPVVVLSNIPNDVDGLICLEAGAAGYISALAAPEMLRQVVDVVANGGLWVGPELMMRLRTALAGQRSAQLESDQLAALTRRQKEVALAAAAGVSNKQIARVMGITERTVKAHLSAIFACLKIGNRVQLSNLVNGERPALKATVH